MSRKGQGFWTGGEVTSEGIRTGREYRERDPQAHWTEGLVMEQLDFGRPLTLGEIEEGLLGTHRIEKYGVWDTVTVDRAAVRRALRGLYEAGYVEAVD